MNFLVLPCVLLLAVWVGAQGQEEAGSFYDSRYDYLDIDAILSSKRLVRNYVDCLLNKKPCSPEGKALRRILPEGLRTKCARCSSRQKHNALVILRGLRDNYPAEWSLLSAKWDPTGDFTKRFVNFLDKDDNNNVDTPIQPILPATNPATNPPPRPAVLSRFGPEEVGDQGSPSEVRPTIRAPPNVNMPPPVVNVPRPAVSGPPPMVNQPPPVINMPPQAFTRSPQATTRSPQLVNLSPIPTVRSPPATARSTMRTTASPTTTTPTPIPITMRLATRPAPRPTQTAQRPRPRPTSAPQFVITADTRPVMGLIDHFGNKIIKTTELVTGLLKSTVRIVVG